MDNKKMELQQFMFYQGSDGNIKIHAVIKDETIWLTQKNIAEVFDIDRSVITKHLKNIFESLELKELAVCANFAHTASDNKKYETKYYNLDAIISVGYRVNSYKATKFRQWSTQILREYLIKGFAIDDERLKQGGQIFGKDYFEQLLERIREIRASERLFYQKITDIYQQCSSDYDKNSPITRDFYARAQNKLEYAIVKMTAAEIIKMRANYKLPTMGLTSWRAQNNNGKITLKDVSIAKNYLTEKEIKELNRLVSMFLDYAENLALKRKLMLMKDWDNKLDDFLKFHEYEILSGRGKISHKNALDFSKEEYEKFRVVQDEQHKSDFDKLNIKIQQGEIPKEKIIKKTEKDYGDFDSKLKIALNFNPNNEN